ncbi:uncharacterized membrane protein/uncharacterized protein YneF (UPF0154 family) [Sphingomonas naasensis]|uniref:DoxX family membrane protein n=1 Tax=Sphingomonas naasensis TaxID=1344951 RepID=A0A4S1W3A1_9SPHN|nr:hypothetical protein [Sphingomonas naasensis]NIJ19646.1 uncharacterized membrane protein/uncharacterized protein YneF (UPF0154 family) [Sphingomonas naasensis]TGX37281.1 hypothetical protein E5A74_20260 [Sphingomonas naasensis]
MSEARAYTLFGRISILVLSIQWIVFGSMHFSHLKKTIAQLPGIFPEPSHVPIVIVTGIAEVAVGILILIAETRKAAAMGSLVLLVLLLPAMYHILETGAAPENYPDIPGWLRTALVPNNIFLAICSVYLWRNPHLGLADPDAAAALSPPPPRWWHSSDFGTPLIAALLLMANIAGFVAAAWPSRDTGAAVLWAMASIAVGALIGFLFAVPRINPEVKVRSRLIPNANVEAVSDWLTKILVGVGLVNFQSIGRFVDGLAGQLSQGTGRTHAYALGLIVYFLAVGVIQGYVLTRIFLTARFRAEMQDDLVG